MHCGEANGCKLASRTCVRCVTTAVAAEIASEPTTLRNIVNSAAASPFCSFGKVEYATVLIGTNRNASPTVCAMRMTESV